MGILGPLTPSFLATKATLIVDEGSVDPRELKFQYNPEQFTLSKSTIWSRQKVSLNASTPPPSYRSTGPRSVTMDVFFDRYSEPRGDVSDDVETLFTWTKPCPMPDGRFSPPVLKFEWGASDVMPEFKGFLSNVSASYTMFRRDGTPVRANCSITIEEIPEEAEGTNPTSGSKKSLRRHVLIEGESLHSIAWAEYGQASYWRALAEFNAIDDPTRVPAGAEILLPPPRDAARMA